ncbi:MAG: sulfur carrier protein ThiS [Rhizobiales bacterium]|nr:sulfur carrier protein ThiS [Hyphomicrobiales bacterium]
MDDRHEHLERLAAGAAPRSLSIVLNGAEEETRATTLAELVTSLDMAPEQVATALNGRFVARAARSACRLTAGDRIEIVSPRQGG